MSAAKPDDRSRTSKSEQMNKQREDCRMAILSLLDSYFVINF